MKKPEVLKEISSADLVFMRFVVMHQKKQEDFIRHLYENMKSGAILILMEPESTTDGKKKMLNQYPYSGILFDFKATLGKKLGLDYDFAQNIGLILENLAPKKIIHKFDDLYITTLQAKDFHKKNIESVSEKSLNKENYTKIYINQYMEAVAKPPSSDSHYWLLDRLHTFITLK